MKIKSYPKWVSAVFCLSAIGWIVMVIIDLVTKQESKILFYSHIALAAIYLICTIVYSIQYAMSNHAKNKQLAAQEAAKHEADKQSAVEKALAQQQAAAQQPVNPQPAPAEPVQPEESADA